MPKGQISVHSSKLSFTAKVFRLCSLLVKGEELWDCEIRPSGHN